jgi:flagellar biosynthetic protein FlhB
MAEQDDDSKEFAPSQRRLDKAREDGDAIRSEELQAAFAMGGLLLALAAAGGWAVRQAGSAGAEFLSRPDLLARSSAAETAGLALRMFGLPLLLLAGPALAVLGWLIGSKGLILAPSRLAIKLSRLSVISNATQKFGRAGLVDFARRALKMLVIGTVLALYLMAGASVLFQSAQLDTGQIALLMGDRILGFLGLVVLVAAVFGAVDYLWQRMEFLRRNRMNRKELLDEMKESEGDPHVKADRRRRAQEIATNRMLADVPKADVVIVNPTHYAVALAWNRTSGMRRAASPRAPTRSPRASAPARWRRACRSGRDPPTARALYAVRRHRPRDPARALCRRGRRDPLLGRDAQEGATQMTADRDRLAAAGRRWPRWCSTPRRAACSKTKQLARDALRRQLADLEAPATDDSVALDVQQMTRFGYETWATARRAEINLKSGGADRRMPEGRRRNPAGPGRQLAVERIGERRNAASAVLTGDLGDQHIGDDVAKDATAFSCNARRSTTRFDPSVNDPRKPPELAWSNSTCRKTSRIFGSRE